MSKHHYQLFNLIAPIYAKFYSWQKRYFRQVLDNAQELKLSQYTTVLDVGCGTGALCSVLQEHGFKVTGVDAAEKMLSVARRQPENNGISFIQTNALEPLPFPDKSFDVSISSYVAHGLKPMERQMLYAEMSRVTKHLVIIHDFNQNGSWLTRTVERLERSDYFRFIKNPVKEMSYCHIGDEPCFTQVKRFDVNDLAAWYMGIPTPIK